MPSSGESPQSEEEIWFHRLLDLDADQRRLALVRIPGDSLRLRVSQLLASADESATCLDTSADLLLDGNGDGFIGATVGPYEIRELIGQGGMGAVYLARQRRPIERDVAIKVVSGGPGTREILARFQAELKVLARLQHPNIAHVLDAGTVHAGSPYFVMELVDGEPITEYCRIRKLELEPRLELFRAICAGIYHAHANGIVHRDIKPSNILVAEKEGRPLVKIIDFGIAKAMEAGNAPLVTFTIPGGVLGTPEYMSPEQLSGDSSKIDFRSDVYGLGALLYELLCGAPPFSAAAIQGRGLDEWFRLILKTDPPPPSKRLQGVDEVDFPLAASQVRGELDWMVMHALEKDPARRYPGAREFDDDVVRFLADRPVSVSPPTVTYRFCKLVSRHRIAAIWIGVAALAIGIGGGVAGYTKFDASRVARKSKEDLAITNLKLERNAAQAKVDVADAQTAAVLAPYFRESLLNEQTQALRVLSQGSSSMKRKFVALAATNPKENVGFATACEPLLRAMVGLDVDGSMRRMILEELTRCPQGHGAGWPAMWTAWIANTSPDLRSGIKYPTGELLQFIREIDSTLAFNHPKRTCLPALAKAWVASGEDLPGEQRLAVARALIPLCKRDTSQDEESIQRARERREAATAAIRLICRADEAELLLHELIAEKYDAIEGTPLVAALVEIAGAPRTSKLVEEFPKVMASLKSDHPHASPTSAREIEPSVSADDAFSRRLRIMPKWLPEVSVVADRWKQLPRPTALRYAQFLLADLRSAQDLAASDAGFILEALSFGSGYLEAEHRKEVAEIMLQRLEAIRSHAYPTRMAECWIRLNPPTGGDLGSELSRSILASLSGCDNANQFKQLSMLLLRQDGITDDPAIREQVAVLLADPLMDAESEKDVLAWAGKSLGKEFPAMDDFRRWYASR